MLIWRLNFVLSLRAGGVAFGIIGAILLACSGWAAYQGAERLRTWPAVDVQVDSAAVVTAQQTRRDMYAARYWVTYLRYGHTVSAVVTQGDYTKHYGSVVRATEAARRSATVRALVNPADAWDLSLDTTWHSDLFLLALVLGFLGLAFGGMGAAFLWVGRRQGMDGATSFWMPLPARYGVVIGVVMGTLFLGTGALAAALAAHQQRTWREVEARVDSVDVVTESDSSGSTYAPRYWLSYALRDSLFRSPLVQSWWNSDYRAQARRAAQAARLGHITVRVNPRDPYDIAGRQSAWDSVLWYGVWGFFTVFSFSLAYVFHRISLRDCKKAQRGGRVRRTEAR